MSEKPDQSTTELVGEAIKGVGCLLMCLVLLGLLLGILFAALSAH